MSPLQTLRQESLGIGQEAWVGIGRGLLLCLNSVVMLICSQDWESWFSSCTFKIWRSHESCYLKLLLSWGKPLSNWFHKLKLRVNAYSQNFLLSVEYLCSFIHYQLCMVFSALILPCTYVWCASSYKCQRTLSSLHSI